MKDRIRSVRNDVGKTQKEFAKELGVTHTYIAEIEGGRRVPSNLFLLAMEYRFGVRKQWIEEGKGEKYTTEKILLTDKEAELIKSFREMPVESKKIFEALIHKLKKGS